MMALQLGLLLRSLCTVLTVFPETTANGLQEKEWDQVRTRVRERTADRYFDSVCVQQQGKKVQASMEECGARRLPRSQPCMRCATHACVKGLVCDLLIISTR